MLLVTINVDSVKEGPQAIRALMYAKHLKNAMNLESKHTASS